MTKKKRIRKWVPIREKPKPKPEIYIPPPENEPFGGRIPYELAHYREKEGYVFVVSFDDN